MYPYSIIASVFIFRILTVQFDGRFTTQRAQLTLQGHPHKGGPTPAFEGFDWRPDDVIELAQLEERGKSHGFLESMTSVFWC